MKSSTDIFYSEPQDYLSQGDIFKIDIVGPIADEVKRIFRTTDGQHGSVFFEGNSEAKIFSQEDLLNFLGNISRTDLHTDPFTNTQDGQAEMVVVPAELFEYFIIATNTCDISGIDRPAQPTTTILPVITLARMCKRTKLPSLRSSDTPISIHSFIIKYCPDGHRLESTNELDYSKVARLTIKGLIESNPSTKLLEDSRRIKNFLRVYYDKGYMFSLPQSPKYNLPESYVDFTTVLTVPTNKVLSIQQFRFVRISERYCDNFARKFGDFFSRLAFRVEMRPS